VLLPYTPLHHLLFRPVAGAAAAPRRTLVMTSGNLTDEPICFDDEEAGRRLAPIADCWLSHDRPIHVPCDDSVVQVESGAEVPVRRSRGYAPLPIRLPFPAVPTLAVGGELKNAFCLASGHDAFMSQHIGDMGSLETRTAFERSTRQFAGFYRIDPVQVAADAHPDYTTRRWADDVSGRPVRLVHHHHAHVAAVMVEHGVPAGERVIGIAFDGTGYGVDGTIWGGEVLVAGYDTFARTFHLRQVPLPGGDAAVRKPYRAALAHLWSAGIEWDSAIPAVGAAAEDERAVLRRQLERGVSCVPTSSMGRLFDAVSSLLGIRHEATYEAQAAVELEWCASAYCGAAPVYQFSLSDGEFDAAPVLHGIVRDLRSGVAVGAIAAGFHAAVAGLIADAAQRQRQETGIGRVALTGGVFQNMLLVDRARRALTALGFQVLTHRLVPPNDGGLALGQAAVAGYRPVEPGGP
jgi:hydrogenase maturation protein HypF